MARTNDFALTYASAHEEAGMTRINLAPILHRIAEDPNYLLSEELLALARPSPAHWTCIPKPSPDCPIG